jgi:hypothetical protein
MKKNPTRKSTALISLVLVPMNLLGLGFTAGCDKGDNGGSVTDASDQAEVVDFDARDPDDPYTLDPVANFAGGPPATQPTTQPLASSGFAGQSHHHYGSYTYTRGHTTYVPVPFRPGYRPFYRPIYRASSYASSSSGSSGYHSSGSSYSRSSPSRSSGSSSSSHSSVSRGGFGSTGHSMSSGS